MTTKMCVRCGEEKDLETGFYQAKGYKGGFTARCRSCLSEDAKIKNARPEVKAATYARIKAERARPGGRPADKKYAKSHKRKLELQRYGVSVKGKCTVAKASAAFRQREPQKCRARDALGNAIKAEKIVRPDRCSNCGCGCIPHGHHEDYSRPYDVEWLCESCHLERHGKQLLP